MEGGSLHDGTSRISREVYVRFCERLGAKVPGPTWRQGGPATFAHASHRAEKGDREQFRRKMILSEVGSSFNFDGPESRAKLREVPLRSFCAARSSPFLRNCGWGRTLARGRDGARAIGANAAAVGAAAPARCARNELWGHRPTDRPHPPQVTLAPSPSLFIHWRSRAPSAAPNEEKNEENKAIASQSPFVTEEPDPKERLRVGSGIVQGLRS